MLNICVAPAIENISETISSLTLTVSLPKKELNTLCKENNINYMGNIDVNTNEQFKNIIDTIDLVILGGYDKIIKKSILNLNSKTIFVNTHYGVIPQNRGCNPTIWSIIQDIPHGYTTYKLTEQIDYGEIYEQYKYYNDNITSYDLYNHLLHVSKNNFPLILNKILLDETYTLNNDKNSYKKQGMPNDSYISWHWNTKFILLFSNCLYFPPYKPSRTIFNNNDIFISIKCIEDSDIEYEPGIILDIEEKNIQVGCHNKIIFCELYEKYDLKIGNKFTSYQSNIHSIPLNFNLEKLQ